MLTCSVENCNNILLGNTGYCSRHHQQMRHYGKILKRTIFDPNEIIIEDTLCRIKLYNIDCIEIAEALFDLEFKPTIEKFKWSLTDKGYVHCTYHDEINHRKKIRLHQAIISLSGQEVPPGYEIDHRDGNKLNNLLSNLRICTRFQNQHNTQLRIDNTSGDKGVIYYKRNNKWQAQIMNNGKQEHLGYFTIKEDAARAYNQAAIQYFGEFAVLNNIP